MNDLDELLPDVFGEMADRAPHDRDLAARVRRRARRGRLIGAGALAGVAAATAAAITVSGLAGSRPQPAPAGSGQGVQVVPACRSTVVRGVLPAWARAGFSDPEPVAAYVRSTSGGIVAILFTPRLTSPASPNVRNKVLWVWREAPAIGADVHLVARLAATGPAVTAGLPTPFGPSIVDLPAPGCWRLTVTWPGGSDTIDLDYVRP